jgi:hypothetical protein
MVPGANLKSSLAEPLLPTGEVLAADKCLELNCITWYRGSPRSVR